MRGTTDLTVTRYQVLSVQVEQRVSDDTGRGFLISSAGHHHDWDVTGADFLEDDLVSLYDGIGRDGQTAQWVTIQYVCARVIDHDVRRELRERFLNIPGRYRQY